MLPPRRIFTNMTLSFSINKALGILPNASAHGSTVDSLLEVCHIFMAVLFVGWSLYFLYTIYRFHQSRHPKADYHGVQSKASAHLEFSVVIIEAVLLLGFAIPLWGRRVNGDQFPPDTDAIRVHAVAEQFRWHFHYPGPDGVFGRQNIDLVSDKNPMGLDPNDPAGADDIVTTNELHLVNNKPVVIEITSKDVIHGLVPSSICVDQPGRHPRVERFPAWFRPIRARNLRHHLLPGFCGVGHSGMRAVMTVEKQEEFDSWMKEQAALSLPLRQPPSAAPATAPATPAAPAPEAPAAK